MTTLFHYLSRYPALVSVTIPTLISLFILSPMYRQLTMRDTLGWLAATALTVISHAWFVVSGNVYILFIPFFALHCLTAAVMTKVNNELRLTAWSYLSILVASVLAAWIGHDLSSVTIEPFYAIVGYHGWTDLLLLIPLTTYVSIKFISMNKVTSSA